MIKEAIEKILSLAPMEKMELHGHKYTSKELYRTKKPRPKYLTVGGLDSLVAYLKEGLDKWEEKSLYVLVDSPEKVSLVIQLGTYLKDERMTVAECTLNNDPFTFGQYNAIDTLLISLQSMFKPTEDREKVTKLIGNISSENETKSCDDGITQSVTMKAGITLKTTDKIINPFILKPYRTFPEIEDQPVSAFVLRVKDFHEETRCALFETDGGLWKVKAMTAIKKYLDDSGIGIPVI